MAEVTSTVVTFPTEEARYQENPSADWIWGANFGSTCAPGIGINVYQGSVAPERLEAWTLLDQYGNARSPQQTHVIGGTGLTRTSDWPGSGGAEGFNDDNWIVVGKTDIPGDSAYPWTFLGDAVLNTIEEGWIPW